MRRKLTWVGLFSAVIMITAFFFAVHVSATPAVGFVGTTLALGRFGEIDVFNHFILPNVPQAGHEGHERHKNNIWLSSQKTKGLSDVYVQNNVWQPGGSTGWHTHPGHSLIIVTAGTITAYEGDDLECKPTVYTQGMGFVDIPVVATCTTSGTRATSWHRPSLYNSFRQIRGVGLTLRTQETATFNEGGAT